MTNWQAEISRKPAPAGGMQRQTSNTTGYLRNANKVLLDCETCGLSFWRYAAWAKRKKHHYCGVGCANEAKRRPTKFSCAHCGGEFIGTPSQLGVIVACSPDCRTALKSNRMKTVRLPRPQTGRPLAERVMIANTPGSSKEVAAKFGISASSVQNYRREIWEAGSPLSTEHPQPADAQ